MKKICIVFVIIAFNVISIFSQNFQTEQYAFTQIKNYHNASSWAKIVEAADSFFYAYPFSQYELEVQYYQAESYLKIGNANRAQNMFENILLDNALDDTMKKNTMYYLSTILFSKGKHEESLSYAYVLIENPFDDEEKNKTILLNCAHSLSFLARHNELIAVIEYYIKTYGEGSIPPEMELLLGNLWLGMGVEALNNKRLEEALEYFERSDLQETNGEKNSSFYKKSGFYQALIYYSSGDVARAIQILSDRIHIVSSVSFEYAALLSIVYGEKKDRSLSELYANQALSQFQEMPQAYNNEINFYLLQKSLYWYAVSSFEKKDYEHCVEILNLFNTISIEVFENSFEMYKEVVLLHAQSLFLTGQIEKAVYLFEHNFPHSTETVKALFLSGAWETAAAIAIQSEDNYLKGLSYFFLGNWDLAYEAFSNLEENAESKYDEWSGYYMSLALYYNGEYSKSLELLSSFLLKAPYHSKAWDAQLISAFCLLQTGQSSRALEHSLVAVRIARTIEQRQTAAVFAAGLYIDKKEYTQANALLLEFSTSNSPSSIVPRLLLAQTYSATGNTRQADYELKRIISQFPNEELAREASYKRGEIFFENGEYREAEQLFRSFNDTYSNGIYSDIALFFEAESRKQQDDFYGAILLHSDLINRYSDSSYRFSSMRELVELHSVIGEYGTALEYVELAQNEYPDDFRSSNLSIKRDELTILTSGIDVEIAKTYIEWQRAGENKTSEGRIHGYELALLYLQNVGEQEKALEILREIQGALEIISGEYMLHANVLQTLGNIYRENATCIDAARYYLQEAEMLTKIANNQENAARALYRAVEAFECAGRIGDANAVYDEMEKNYKNSVWYDRASTLLIKN